MQRKQDFNHAMSMLELKPDNNGCKLFVAFTKNTMREISTILRLERKNLENLKAQSEDKTLVFESWEVSEIINICKFATFCRAEKGEETHLKDLDARKFYDFKLSLSLQDYLDPREDLDIDSSIDQITICKTMLNSNQSNNFSYESSSDKSRMTKEDCLQLSTEAKSIWNRLDDKSKAIILLPSRKSMGNEY